MSYKPKKSGSIKLKNGKKVMSNKPNNCNEKIGNKGLTTEVIDCPEMLQATNNTVPTGGVTTPRAKA